MFGFKKNKRAVQVTLVKTKDNDASARTIDEILNPDSVQLIEETGKRFVKYVAAVVVGVIVTVKIADTLGDIAVKKTKSADND